MRHLPVVAWLAVMAATSVWTSVSAAPVTFQGLGGTATRDQVKRAFPGVVTKNHCQPTWTVLQSSDGRFKCEALEVADYKVGDTSFKAVFLFRDSDDKLGQVYLAQYFGLLGQNSRLKKFDVLSLYIKWRDLLALKYGQERGTKYGIPGCFGIDTQFMYNLCSKWQANKSSDWDDSEGTIDLEVEGSKSAADDDYDVDLSITYRLVDTDAAGRL